MPIPQTEISTLWKAIERLEKANISYMLTGSMAMNAYGHARATNDFDIVIAIQRHHAKELVSLFEQDCYISPESVTEAIQRQGMFNVIDNETIFKIDFIVAKNEPFAKQQFERRQSLEIQGKKIYVISPEDLILSKLAWSQESLSELQERDIQNILRIMGNKLDKAYLEKWANEKGFQPRLKRLYENI